jgi:Tfp pilus assembly protein FimT
MPASKKHSQGFSLVELIVIIVVAGFLGAVLGNLMGTQLLKSGAPLASAQDAARAEATMESVVAYYAQVVNSDTSTALDAVAAHYPNNATFTATRNNNFEGSGVDALIVTVTEGGASLTTILTQERTSSADNATTF